MSLMDRIVDFCASLDPGFPAKIRGASRQDIDRLEQAMGRPCSPLYRAFLERMGEDTAWIELGRYSPLPRDLLEHRSEVLASLPAGIELFAMPVADDDEDVFLVHGGGPDPEVVRREGVPEVADGMLDRTDVEEVAGSFSELLCLPALNLRHTALLPFQGSYSEPERRPDSLARCRRLATFFAFEPWWFSNPSTLAARRGTLTLVAKQAPGWYFSLGLAGNDEFEWGVVARTLVRELELEQYR